MTESTRRPADPGEFDIRAEIERVHDLLAAWLGTAASPQILDRFAAAHADEFSMVTTGGTVIRKRELLTGLHRARNSRPGLTIDISEVETLCTAGNCLVVRFVEYQQDSGGRGYRRTTAALQVDPESYSCRWVTLQETAAPADSIE